jgi:hypothetical protein
VEGLIESRARVAVRSCPVYHPTVGPTGRELVLAMLAFSANGCLAPKVAPVEPETQATGPGPVQPVGAAPAQGLWDGEEPPGLRRASGWASCKPTSDCSASVEVMPRAGKNGTTGLRFHVEQADWAGLGWHWLGLLAIEGTDVRPYDSLRFSIRVVSRGPDLAPPPDRIWLALAGPNGVQSGPRALGECAETVVDGRWHDFVIPLLPLFRAGNRGFDPKNVTGLTVFTSALSPRTFDLFLDGIAVERTEQEALRKACDRGALSTPVEPRPERPQNNPNDCVDPPAPDESKHERWDEEIDRRIDGQLPKMLSCSAGLTGPEEVSATIRLGFKRDGAPLTQHVVASSLTECKVADCIKRGLATLHAPVTAMPEDTAHDVTLLLRRGSLPRRMIAEAAGKRATSPDAGTTCRDNAVPGVLNPEHIQQVVRSHYDQFRRCYEGALARNPASSGRVTVRFVIGTDGKVTAARVQENTLADCEAVHCMLEAYRDLSFPAPSGGMVTVVYPIMFAPG